VARSLALSESQGGLGSARARIRQRSCPVPRVPSYALHEEGGFLWLRHGSSELPPPTIPELDEDVYRFSFRYEIPCPQRSILENAADPVHMRMIHGFPTERVEVLDLEETESSLSYRLVHHATLWGQALRSEVAFRFVSPTVITGSWRARGRIQYWFVSGTLPVDSRRTTFWNSILVPKKRGRLLDAPRCLLYGLSMWNGTRQDLRVWRDLEPEAQRATVPEEHVLARFRRFYGRHVEPEGAPASPSGSRARRTRLSVPTAPSPL